VAGTPDLHLAHVDARHSMTGGTEISGDGDTATEIDDAAFGIQSIEQRSDPGRVLLGAGVISPVAPRQGVIAAPDHLDRLVLLVGHHRNLRTAGGGLRDVTPCHGRLAHPDDTEGTRGKNRVMAHDHQPALRAPQEPEVSACGAADRFAGGRRQDSHIPIGTQPTWAAR
jgi:hypothetical protein